METFKFQHTVKFSEVDQAGVVFFSRYFEIAHSSLEAFFHHLGWGFAKVFSEGKDGFPLIHAEANYMAPARLGDTLEVALSLSRISESSFTVSYDFRSTDGKPAARLSTNHVWVELKTFSKAPIPTELKTALQDYLAEDLAA